MLTLDKIYSAKYILKQVIRETDVIRAPKINPDSDIYLKTENLQITGSFKVRGAYYRMSQLSDEEKAKGVIACSAGNHAQGVALAAAKNGIKSIICRRTERLFPRLKQQKATAQRFALSREFTMTLMPKLSASVTNTATLSFIPLTTKTLSPDRVR